MKSHIDVELTTEKLQNYINLVCNQPPNSHTSSFFRSKRQSPSRGIYRKYAYVCTLCNVLFIDQPKYIFYSEKKSGQSKQLMANRDGVHSNTEIVYDNIRNNEKSVFRAITKLISIPYDTLQSCHTTI